MSYWDELYEEANYTLTLNGAKTHGSTGDACLDFFAVAGGMRYRSREEQIRLFDRAYIETPDLAMKLLFYLRDIRGGMGERKLFRTLIRHAALTWPESVIKNVPYIAEFGRWDDMLCLLDTPAQTQMVQVIRQQLEEDEAALKRRESGEEDAHISLLAKWMPSDNTSSPRTRRNAQRLMSALGMNNREYRRRVTALRAKQPDKVNYEAVPAQAMLKYRKAFNRQDKERFEDYLSGVEAGEKKINADTLFPYEVLRPFFSRRGYVFSENPDSMETLEQLWNHLPGAVADANAISVVDTSEIRGANLRDKLKYISTLPWGGSTNLEGVFDLILQTAVKYNVKQEELPSVIYIFSDMEFNWCVHDADNTVYDNAREQFEINGYQMPAVVFHNVNSWQMQTPVTAHTRGTALSSGAATGGMRFSYNGNITPMEHMLRVLESERYKMIRA